jgi:hypothetical protein
MAPAYTEKPTVTKEVTVAQSVALRCTKSPVTLPAAVRLHAFALG